MSAILILPIDCLACGQRRMVALRPADVWECDDCRRRKYGEASDVTEPPPTRRDR